MVVAMSSQVAVFRNPRPLLLVKPAEVKVPGTQLVPSHLSVGKVLESNVIMCKVGSTCSTKFLFHGQRTLKTQLIDQGLPMAAGKATEGNSLSSAAKVAKPTRPSSTKPCAC